MLHLIAQTTQSTTQPAVDTGIPGWALGIIAVIGALAPIIIAWMARQDARDAKTQAASATATAASADGKADAAQQSVSRQAVRVEGVNDRVVGLARDMTPPPKSSEAGGAG
jgi:hypothetical protein